MNKLSPIAPHLVHKCQAAFIKGHSIFDQVNLVNCMTDLCELIGQDGMIIALDQEKAYDRVRHEYLWRVMETMGIPNTFTSIIQKLYANTKTKVILNSNISENFSITRGICQGDPLSCLLFNIPYP
jgi:hypothetical protein